MGLNIEGKDCKAKTSPSRTEFISSVFQDWKKSIEVLDEKQRTVTDYCRYDLTKIKECIVRLQRDQSFVDLQNDDLQITLDKLLYDIDTHL